MGTVDIEYYVDDDGGISEFTVVNYTDLGNMGLKKAPL